MALIKSDPWTDAIKDLKSDSPSDSSVAVIRDYYGKNLEITSIESLMDVLSISESCARRIKDETVLAVNSPLYPPHIAAALDAASKGIHIGFLPGGKKNSYETEWEEKATTNKDEIVRRAQSNPSWTNIAWVAKAIPGGRLMWDTDKPEIITEYEKLWGSLNTLTNRSFSGASHFIFEHTAASIALQKELNKAWIKEKDEDGEVWSLRMNNAYVVGPTSSVTIDGVTGEYKTIRDLPIVPIPNSLLTFLKERYLKSNEKESAGIVSNGPIGEGSRNDVLFKLGSSYRNQGLEHDEILTVLLRVNTERCVPPLSDSEVETIANSIMRYKQGDPLSDVVLVGGQVAGTVNPDAPSSIPAMTNEQVVKAAAVITAVQDKAEQKRVEIESRIDYSAIVQIPKFPRHLMEGTSLYRNLVEPTIKVSTKLPEMIFMPAVVSYLNCLSGHVRIGGVNHTPLTMNLGIIGNRGYYKSSSAELAQKFFETMGLSCPYRASVRDAEGRQLVVSVGSTEGLGRVMAGVRATRAILYFDELRKVVRKMNIEGSSFAGDLLTFYEAGHWSNNVVSSKTSFNFPAGSYCVSWVFCSTRKAFDEAWPQVMASNTDLIDRMFFILGPEDDKGSENVTLYNDPDLISGAVETQQLITTAIQKGVYDYLSIERAKDIFKSGLGDLLTRDEEDTLDLSSTRLVNLAQKLALYFAVDLDDDGPRNFIDDECVERAVSLVRYRVDAIRYLRPIEADSQLGRLQQLMIQVVRNHGGSMPRRDWQRLCNYNRRDTELWWRAENGLSKIERISFQKVKQTSGQNREFVYLLKEID